MEFITKAEHFFSQLQYSLAIDPESIVILGNKQFPLLLHPSIHAKVIHDYKIDYPFLYENKIMELKNLIINESIAIHDALVIVENFKKYYWSPGTIIILAPQIQLLNKILEMDKSNTKYIDIVKEFYKYPDEIEEYDLVPKMLIENKELLEKYNQYQNYLSEKRESIFDTLIDKITDKTDWRSTSEEVEQNQENGLKLGLRGIALLYYYTDKKITLNNANDIAEKYGLNSGPKLLTHFSQINASSLDIVNHRYAVKDLTTVISHLFDNFKAKEKAEIDLKTAQQKRN